MTLDPLTILHSIVHCIILLGHISDIQNTMKVGIVNPISESCRVLANKLLDVGSEVAFLCLDQLDVDLAQHMIQELTVVGKVKDYLYGRKDSFSVVHDNLSDCNVVGEYILFLKTILARVLGLQSVRR